MGKRGPPPKPSKLKLLEGTYRPDRAANNEPQPKAEHSACPNWLSPDGKKKWKEYAEKLTRLGLLDELSEELFAQYCHWWGRFRQAQRLITKHGAPVSQREGYQKLEREAQMMMNRLAKEFGFGPGSRSHVNVPKQQADPLEDFLKRGRKKA